MKHDISSTEGSMLRGVRRQGELADIMLSDLVLTQGGEPTFVPEDTSAAHWNLEALGDEKLDLAWGLCRELQRTLFQEGLILRSNGKHYPGEPVPRWRLILLRAPGNRPLWRDKELLTNGTPGKGKAISPRRFLSALAKQLGVPGTLRPAYEDVEEAMRGAELLGEPQPIPRYSRTKKGFLQPRWTTAQRRRWEKLHRSVGSVLPLDSVDGVWKSDNWVLPNGELVLLPGTSSIGLRLPLHRLPENSLPRALTAEIRNGSLTLFLPPFTSASSFVELLQAIENTAVALSSPPVALEGYPPPDEEGWLSMSVIPDPGVIEVNLPPAADWGSLEKTVVALFEAASKTGLKGTRILPSGEVVPTGGGGHLVLGGPSLEKNPFLIKPCLLPSFLRFIQRHPSLSYVFSGRFVGPSSQAPRVDESFHEVPNELEIALRALEGMPSPADPAMVDAILRNLLLDLHGNTHKAEVSVDKFFNPFMPNGRLGLVEFRSIEMSPDAQSLLAIHALWRALAAAFVREPYAEPLIRWGGTIHDHYLLPSFLEEDLSEIFRYLRGFGFTFDIDWFTPHLLHRFPILSEVPLGEGKWILRRAAEPWPLLGEQPSASGGLVRCVDSSTERLEIHLSGSAGPIDVTVNGFPLNMWPHPSEGSVGAVRFRSTLLPTCLHPQVAPHVPLELQFFLKGESLGVWHYHPLHVEQEDGRCNIIRVGKPTHIGKELKVKTLGDSKTLDLRALS